jgi:hypothetical protein
MNMAKSTDVKGTAMRKITFFTTMMTAAVVVFLSVTLSQAGFPAPPGLPGLPAPPLPGVNVQINGYLPAPPGVHVYVDGGRPYYMERERRVYVERDRKHHKDKRRHGREYREHGDRGNGHGKHNGHD